MGKNNLKTDYVARHCQLGMLREKIADIIEATGNAAGLMREAMECVGNSNNEGAVVCATDAQDCFAEAERVINAIQVDLAKWMEGNA